MWHEARVGERRNAYDNLVGNEPEQQSSRHGSVAATFENGTDIQFYKKKKFLIM
jgi:hypothetical protein